MSSGEGLTAAGFPRSTKGVGADKATTYIHPLHNDGEAACLLQQRFSNPATLSFVLLPKDFCFDVDEVEITRKGDAVVLRPPADSAERWQNLLSALGRGFSEDFMANGREQPLMPPDDTSKTFD